MTQQPGPLSTFLNFDLQVIAAGDGYRARVGLPSARRVTGTHEFQFKSEERDELLEAIGRLSAQSGELDQLAERDGLAQLGALLFQRVFDGELLELYRTFESAADEHEAVLRIRLNLAGAPELAQLPWEYLFDRQHGEFVFTSRYRSLVRSPVLRKLPRKPVELPLRILLMAYAPPELPRIDLESEVAKIEKALDELRSRKVIDIEVLQPATLSELQGRLRKTDAHIFHYVGHGRYDPDIGDGVLYFEPESGKMTAEGNGSPPGATQGSDLGALLKDEKSLRLVVLNACEGATSGHDYYSGIAQSMVRAGVPAVIGMQAEVTDHAAITFSQEFYRSLADGYPVDSAVAEGRKAILTQVNHVEWGIPALFSQVKDGSILGLRFGPDGQRVTPAEELEVLRKKILRDWGERASFVDSMAGETLEQALEASPAAEEVKPARKESQRPPQVWIAAASPDTIDWEVEFNRGKRIQTLDAVYSGPKPQDAILLYSTHRRGEELVGWATAARLPGGITIEIQELFLRPLTRAELERHAPDLPVLESDKNAESRRVLFRVSPEQWAVIRQLLEHIGGQAPNPDLPLSSVPQRYALLSSASAELPPVVSPREGFEARVKLQNGGNTTWLEQDVFSVECEFRAPGVEVPSAHWSGPIGRRVLPRGEDELVVGLTAPWDPGTFQVRLHVAGPSTWGENPYLDLVRAEIEVREQPTIDAGTAVQEQPSKEPPPQETDVEQPDPSAAAPEMERKTRKRSATTEPPASKTRRKSIGKGATALRKDPPAPPTDSSLTDDQRDRVVQVHSTIFNTVVAGLERPPESFASTTLDVHIHPSPHRRVADVVGGVGPEVDDKKPYSVTLTLQRYDGGAQPNRYFNGPLNLDEGELTRRGGRGDPEYGEALHRALFHDDVPGNEERLVEGEAGQASLSAGYQQARALADNGHLRFQLRIDGSLGDLHQHGWEYLWDHLSGLRHPVACDAQTPFARFLQVSGAGALDRPTIGPKNRLRMLAVLASPAILDDASKRYSRERGALRGLKPVEQAELDALLEQLQRLDGLEPMRGPHVMTPGSGVVSLDAVDHRLEDAADRNQPYQVLHLLCHGVVGEDGRGYVVMDQAARDVGQRPPLIDEKTFAGRIGTHVAGGLRLVVLASCFTATPAQGRALGGVARRLVEEGVPAVVAMQDTLQYESAQHFSQRLYRHLLHSGEIDLAVNAARLELREQSRGSGTVRADEWGIPVLFMRQPDGRLFDVDETARPDSQRDAPTHARPYAEMGNADPDRLVQDAMQMASSALGGISGFDMAGFAAAMREAVRPGAPEVDEAKPRRLFSKPGQEARRWALLRAASDHRRLGTRRTVLFLRRLAARRIRQLAAELTSSDVAGADLAELSRRFHSTVARPGKATLGMTELTIGGAHNGPSLAGRPVTAFRDAWQGFRSRRREGEAIEIADAERLKIEGNLLWETAGGGVDDPAGLDWNAGVVEKLRRLIGHDGDRWRVYEGLVAEPPSPELDAGCLSVLLHATEPDRFAPYRPELATTVLADHALGNDGAPEGTGYSQDYRGFNRLVFDLIADVELGLEGADDAVLLLQGLAAGIVPFRPDAAPEGHPRVGLTEVDLDPKALDTVLVVPPCAVDQAVAALAAGKHTILTGPPGTGKTTLAEDLCRLAFDHGANRGHVLATATSDWTTFDTIGGYAPDSQGRLVFRPGVFLNALRSERWLVIDEINRADIDKAFGELFTVLSGQAVTLPYLVGGRPVRILPPGHPAPDADHVYSMPRSWRIVGTMNVYDRASLFAMSKAFMRRFAFIEVDVPDSETYRRLLGEFLRRIGLDLTDNAANASVKTKLEELFDRNDTNPLMRWRTLGPAIAKDVIGYLQERRSRAGSLVSGDIADALSLYVVPQLDDLLQDQVRQIHDDLKSLGSEDLNRRIRALFPFFTFGQEAGGDP